MGMEGLGKWVWLCGSRCGCGEVNVDVGMCVWSHVER